MTNGNSIHFVGNVTREPELRYSAAGNAYLTLPVACNRSVGQGDARKDEAEYFDCKVFGELAEHVAETCSKGQRVFVLGRIKTETWGEGDAKRWKAVVMVDEIGPTLRWATAVVTRAERTGGGGGQRPAAAPAAVAAGDDAGHDPFGGGGAATGDYGGEEPF